MKKYRVKIDCPGFCKDTIHKVYPPNYLINDEIYPPQDYPDIFEEIKEEEKVSISLDVFQDNLDNRKGIKPLNVKSNDMFTSIKIVIKNFKHENGIATGELSYVGKNI